MRKYIVFLCATFILLPSLLLSQSNEIGDFKINDEDKIVWQVIFDTNLDFNQICKAVENKGILQYEIKDNYIIGKVINYNMNLFGTSRMSAPFIITLNTYSFDYRIDYKDGRYRVTVRNFILTTKEANPLFGPIGTISMLEDILKKRRKPEFVSTATDALILIDKNLETIFSFKQDTNDDW